MQINKCALLACCAHFFVDLSCTAMLAALPGTHIVLWAIVYNGLAFAFQLPVGALADSLDLRSSLSAIGCLLTAAGIFLPSPLAMCLLLGLGNACFHVGGGREALLRSKKPASSVGRFVAPGALGIFFGPKLSATAGLPSALCLVLLLFAAGFFLTREPAASGKRTLSFSPLRLRQGLSMVCLFLTVLLRSYTGTLLRYPFFSSFGWALGFSLCIFLGKYFGGIFSDRWGVLPVSTAAQLSAALLLWLSASVPVLAFPAIFLFNTSMAVTAAQLYQTLPRLPGTMFGLTTFSLYLGVLPRLLGWEIPMLQNWGVLGLLSALLLLGGILLGKEGGRNAEIAGSIPGADADP